MYCQKCGKKLENDSQFCSNCGEKVEKEVKQSYCTHCGKKIDSTINICPFCNQNVATGYSNTPDEESMLLQISAFLVPIAGLIIWATTKDKTPNRANGVIKWAGAGFIFFTLLRILF